MIRRLAAQLGSFRKNAIIGPILVALEVVVDVIIPFLMARIIDVGIAASDLRAIAVLGVLLIACAFLSLLLGVVAGRHAAVASSGLARNLRRAMYDAIQRFSFANIDRFTPSSLVTRLTTDVSNVQNAFQSMLRILIRSPLMLVFSMMMAFRVNNEVALIFLGITPLLGLGLYFIITRAHPIFEWVIRIYDRLNTVVSENLRGIRVVKAFVREDHEIEKFSAVSRDIYGGFSRAEKILALNAPLMQFAIYSCTVLIAWLGARLIIRGTMTTGQLVGLIVYATQILMSLNLLSMVLTMIAVSRASAERIVEILDEKSTMTNIPEPVTALTDGSIRFEDVSFGYGGAEHAQSLKNVSLSIASGETIGIVGGTGSGKTTLVQLIPRLYDATTGVVKVGGRDVRDYDIATLRARVAMVLQKNVLFSGTVRENLLWGNRDASDEEIRQACRLAQAEDFIAALPEGYDSPVAAGGTNFSGGQRQRLCIARSLLKNPAVLILDDSTSALDTRTDERLRQALRDSLPGVTKLIIAQRVASVMTADRIIVMDGGRVNGYGTHEELLRDNAIYREVYQSQTRENDGALSQ